MEFNLGEDGGKLGKEDSLPGTEDVEGGQARGHLMLRRMGLHNGSWIDGQETGDQ
jgi:hypothetical protein